ncbi:MAG TPA: hypothetical protein VEA80_10665 [Vitreimonas sp.]|uniref:hypothetical protein n=1 Tax=Vitreimonas sp. TaxID=3069702 RepID=UPI002D35AE9F|nr:hypothetical protein [Vitreimonas sp.]HYD87928.1 hypothetical protein [Vitreimonas sp.]
MTRIEQAIKALEELPETQQEEVADLILTYVANNDTAPSALTDEQWAEVRRRQARGFKPADPARLDQIIDRLK